jgi:succinate dehydrogenase / fumarate reductase cytochrome b subunit
VVAFSQSWYTLFYVVSMIALSFHLWHGFQSAFQTLGLNHKKYTPLIEVLGKIYSVLVPSLFATLPIWVYFFKL